jgi:hypothetical protein
MRANEFIRGHSREFADRQLFLPLRAFVTSWFIAFAGRAPVDFSSALV